MVRAAEAMAAAAGMRWPLLLKAAHGGGGRGIRFVESAEAMEEAFGAAAREAERIEHNYLQRRKVNK